MKTSLLFTLGLLSTASPAAALKVAATIPDLASLAQEVGGDRVQVVALALATQDPHWVDARPNLALELSRVDLLLLAGLELEVGWLPNLIVGSRNPAIQVGAAGYLDCARFIQPLEVPAGKIERSMGDVHPGGNPHYFYDPRAMVQVARGLAAKLAELDPAGAAQYQAGAQGFARAVDERLAQWTARLAPFRGTKFIDYHNAWPYAAEWLGLVNAGHVEPRPGIAPSPAHVAQLIGAARAQGVRLLLQESYHPPTTARLIAEKSGAKLVLAPGGTDHARGERYLERIDRLVGAIGGALEGGR